MKKISIIMALSLVLVFGLALQSWANLVSITNIGGSTKYTIDSFTPGGSIQETYGDNAKTLHLVPYNSHDGFAVVDLNLAGAPIFFDKSITISSNAANYSHEQLVFHVANNTQFPWSDYHFILQFDGVTPPDNLRFSTPNSNDSDLKGQTLVLSGSKIVEIDFFATAASQNIQPNTGSNFSIGFDFDVPAVTGTPITFELRQVATAVPIPAALPLFGSGLLGLGLLGWRRK